MSEDAMEHTLCCFVRVWVVSWLLGWWLCCLCSLGIYDSCVIAPLPGSNSGKLPLYFLLALLPRWTAWFDAGFSVGLLASLSVTGRLIVPRKWFWKSRLVGMLALLRHGDFEMGGVEVLVWCATTTSHYPFKPTWEQLRFLYRVLDDQRITLHS